MLALLFLPSSLTSKVSLTTFVGTVLSTFSVFWGSLPNCVTGCCPFCRIGPLSFLLMTLPGRHRLCPMAPPRVPPCPPPILSAIYTFLLLRLAESWDFCSLQLYIDDSSITASGPTFHSSTYTATQYYEVVSEWLLHCGLTTDPDKLEFISFHRPGHLPAALGAPFSHLGVHDAVHGILTVPCSLTIRYLSVYLHTKLSWDAHIKIMCCCTCSMVCALHILGNSICGLDFANWCRVFHAIILPVLTYGSQLWFSGRMQHICLIK